MTVLIIEDIPEWQEKIAQALWERGAMVLSATTIPEAYTQAHVLMNAVRNGVLEQFIVFADHDMPMDEGGYDDSSSAPIVRLLREALPHLPIVAISAVESNNEHLIAVGANIACVKGELLQCMDEVLARCQEISQDTSA